MPDVMGDIWKCDFFLLILGIYIVGKNRERETRTGVERLRIPERQQNRDTISWSDLKMIKTKQGDERALQDKIKNI